MRILITGASQGLGAKIAEVLANENHDVVIAARNQDNLVQFKEQILSKSSGQVHTLAADLSKKEGIQKLSEFCISLGGVEVLINNLGIYEVDNVLNLDEDLLDKMLDTNLKSAIRITQALSDSILENKGQIININSVTGHRASAIASSYSISKHALKGWSDALRESMRGKGVKVISLYPAAINTTSWDGVDANRSAMIQTEDLSQLISTLLKLGPTTLVEELYISPLDFE